MLLSVPATLLVTMLILGIITLLILGVAYIVVAQRATKRIDQKARKHKPPRLTKDEEKDNV